MNEKKRNKGLTFSEQIVFDSSSHSRTRTICLLEAATPFARRQTAIIICIASVNEWLDASLILIVFQVKELRRWQRPIIVNVQMAKLFSK